MGYYPCLRDDVRILSDYSLTVEEVYVKFAEKVVLAGGAAQLLDSAGLHRRFAAGTGVTFTAPSWVPDWRVQTQIPNAIYRLRKPPYRASVSMAPAFSIVATKIGSALATPVLLADTITWTTPVLLPGAAGRCEDPFIAAIDMISHIVDTHQDLCRSQYNGGPGHTSLAEFMVRTLLMDDLKMEGEGLYGLYTAEISKLGEILRKFQEESDWLNNRSRVWPGMKVPAIASFGEKIRATLPGRRFTISETGYMGLVPAVAEPGDLVAVIPGGSIPYILREVDDFGPETGGENQYRFVGDCYVHGIMYGEALEKHGPEMHDILIV